MTVDPLAYPFAPASESFVLGDGARGDTVVLAYGSNRSPEVLRRKLGDDVSLAATAVTLEGFDVVYSAHIAPYGAIPATLHPAAGRSVVAAALRVTDEQFAALAATEPNYVAHTLRVALEGEGPMPGAALAFISKHGALRGEGGPVRLQDATQREVQDLVRARLAPSETLDEFIAANAADPERAARFTAVLRRDGVPFGDV